MSASEKLGLVVIGRNEGERLAKCLASVRTIPRRVYVDSGSTDGSVELARGEGVTVVELAVPPPFTAARARNAGIAQLLAEAPDIEFVQMLDGDCEMRPGWTKSALASLSSDSELAVVFGRLRERYPERSIYNALCDDEWNIRVGESPGCGGSAMFRISALRQVDFYNTVMIAGEDSELSMRLRKRRWKVLCIDAEMALHDAAISRFGQWWNRTRRAGHGFGEMAFLHPDTRNPNWPRTVRRILFWGALFPFALLVFVLLGFFVKPLWLAAAGLAALWSLRVAMLIVRELRRGLRRKVAFASGLLLMIGKLPQFLGLVRFHRNRVFGRASELIEYKGQ